ncbi:hypothetical protein [Oceanobacillus rekensis]|uniref:flagellin N-terminal helical domain-containing protein n=1 Tax=Oceanobacillus rekensis TaxID=937927 RepID=UPI000B43B3ED|nr:hypothetical protein [Oceanobacillus rekensis]
MNNSHGEHYHQLQWTKDRIKYLDVLEGKLQIMRDLAEDAASDQITENQRKQLNKEFQQLQEEVNNMVKEWKYREN